MKRRQSDVIASVSPFDTLTHMDLMAQKRAWNMADCLDLSMLQRMQELHSAALTLHNDLVDQAVDLEVSQLHMLSDHLKLLEDQLLQINFTMKDTYHFNKQVKHGKLSINTIYALTRIALILLSHAVNAEFTGETIDRSVEEKVLCLLREKGLCLYRTTQVHQMSVYQLWRQLKCIQCNWVDVTLDADFRLILECIEKRLAELICLDIDPRELTEFDLENSEQHTESQRKLVDMFIQKTSNCMCAGDIFVEQTLGIVAEMRYMLYALSFCDQMFERGYFPSELLKCDQFRASVVEQTQSILDETFRDLINDQIMLRFIRPGERLEFIRLNYGNVSDDVIFIMEKTRPLLQITWITGDCYRSSKSLPFVREIEFRFLFDVLMKSRAQVFWLDYVYFTEKDVLEYIKEITVAPMPVVLHVVNRYYVIYKRVYYACESIEQAVLLWIYMMGFGDDFTRTLEPIRSEDDCAANMFRWVHQDTSSVDLKAHLLPYYNSFIRMRETSDDDSDRETIDFDAASDSDIITL